MTVDQSSGVGHLGLAFARRLGPVASPVRRSRPPYVPQCFHPISARLSKGDAVAPRPIPENRVHSKVTGHDNHHPFKKLGFETICQNFVLIRPRSHLFQKVQK
jgi:hypothetical protein